jgi:hypothetical protein
MQQSLSPWYKISVTQRVQNRLQRAAAEVAKREMVYADFVMSASQLLLSAYLRDDIALSGEARRSFSRSCGSGLRLFRRRRHLNLLKQRHDLRGTKPLLRHDKTPFQNGFYQSAWSKKSQSGQLEDQRQFRSFSLRD